MKALVYLGPGSMELRDVEDPADGLVLRVLGAGVCGTDIKTFLKGHHMFPPPAVLGHECVGRVERAPGDSPFAAGDLVALAPYIECGDCGRCRKGLGQLCREKRFVSGGCFAEFVGMSPDYARAGLFALPSADPVYTLAEPLACVLNGMDKLRLDSGRRVLVLGTGPMGALFCALLEARGVDFSFLETAAPRRDLAMGWGWTPITRDEAAGAGFDQIVLTVNRPELVQECVGMAADGGNVLLFSGFARSDRATVDPYDIHYREVSITGTFGYARGHFVRALEVLSREETRFARLITHRMPLARGLGAMELLRRGEAMKVVLEP